MQEFRYEIHWPAAGNRPGHHRSLGRGGGYEFKQHVSLWSDPDPRRLDLHASLRDPLGEWKVRAFRERRAVTVHVLADLSASIGFRGERNKLDVLADFVMAAAYSAYRIGDAFGFIGAAGTLIEDLQVPAGRTKGLGLPLAERIRRLIPEGNSIRGLFAAAERLGRQRALVFLASDFHCELTELNELLGALAHHAVVPLVLWDPAESSVTNRWNFAEVRDLESGRRRALLLRPSLNLRIGQALRERQRELRSLFLLHGLRPLAFERGFDADVVTHYFAGGNAWPDVAP